MRKIRFVLAAVAVVLTCCRFASADVKLPKTFTDNAVLQRDIPVAVWGWADAGEEVTVTYGDESASAKAGDDGQWLVKLGAMPGSFEARDLVVKGKNAVVLKNVVVGDVWVCSGQSNMEQPLNSWGQPRNACSDEEISGDYSFVRFNRANHVVSETPFDDVNCRGWLECKGGVQKDCSACGFHFAVRLSKELNVPVGLIDSNWGGSNINSWIPNEGWGLLPELTQTKADYDKRKAEAPEKIKPIQEAIEKVKADTTLAADVKNKKIRDLENQIQWTAGTGSAMFGGMFNAMLAPWTKYAIRGAIWYQGESNAGEREFYFFKQKAMIMEWRKLWNQGDFPFYWVQLANFTAPKDDPADSGDWPGLRDGQTKCLEVANTGQAVIIDIGEEKDIHPRDKFDVGNRLALWALADVFGKDLEPQSPTFKEMKIDGNKAILTFDHVGSGLVVGKKFDRTPFEEDAAGKLARFAVAGEDQKWVWADAKIIDKATVEVTAEGVTPTAVRYAWQMNPTGANLYSAEGLPTTPFRTDIPMPQ